MRHSQDRLTLARVDDGRNGDGNDDADGDSDQDVEQETHSSVKRKFLPPWLKRRYLYK